MAFLAVLGFIAVGGALIGAGTSAARQGAGIASEGAAGAVLVG